MYYRNTATDGTFAFADPLPDSLPSEPHYVWMEAGTNAFSDRTFTSDSNPSSSNSTSSTAHLSTQITAAGSTWLSYQEGLNSTTGACPIASSGFYAPKHDPFVFFQDISGNPPSDTNARCAAHHLGIDAFWEAEWKKNVFETAVARICQRVKPKHAQIFDLYAVRHWPAAKVAGELGVSIIQVYLVNHRLTKLLKAEVGYIRKKLE